MNISAAVLSSALLDELFGFNPLALENLFLTKDWTFEGDNNVQTLTDADLTADGIPYAPSGNDTAYLREGDDVLYGGNKGGTDSMYGGEGQDVLYAGNNADKLWGDASNDLLDGGTGNDDLFSGDGDDTIIGGNGDDDLDGGMGADVFIFDSTSNTGDDMVTGYDAGEDTLQINDTAFFDANVLADYVQINHSGATITLSDTIIANEAEYIDLVTSFNVTFDGVFELT